MLCQAFAATNSDITGITFAAPAGMSAVYPGQSGAITNVIAVDDPLIVPHTPFGGASSGEVGQR